MRDRPNYMPPIHFGEGRRPQTPRGVYWTLLFEPPSAGAGVILLLVLRTPTCIRILSLIALIGALVQAIVYIPRARRAMAEERAADLEPSSRPRRRS
jgi:hypothetical protein